MINKLPSKKNRVRHSKTFLQRVEVLFEIDSPVDKARDKFIKRMPDFVLNHYGKVLPQQACKTGVLILEASSLAHKIIFNDNSVSIILRGSKYTCFEQSVMPVVFNAYSFFSDVLQYRGRLHVSIRKINIWQIDNEKQEMPYEQIEPLILSPVFCGLVPDNNFMPDEEDVPLKKKIEIREDRTAAIIRTAYLPSQNPATSKNKLLVLDIQVRESCLVHQVNNRLPYINQKCYNIFRWVMNDSVLAIMK